MLEYNWTQIIDIDQPRPVKESFNYMARQGWELVQIIPAPRQEQPNYAVCIWKRERRETE